MEGFTRWLRRRWYDCEYYAGRLHLSPGRILRMALPGLAVGIHGWYWVVIPVVLWMYSLHIQADRTLEHRGLLNFHYSAHLLTEDEYQEAYSRYNRRLERIIYLEENTLIFFGVWFALTLIFKSTL